MSKKFGKDRTVVFGDMLADWQTQAHRQKDVLITFILPTGGGVTNTALCFKFDRRHMSLSANRPI